MESVIVGKVWRYSTACLDENSTSISERKLPDRCSGLCAYLHSNRAVTEVSDSLTVATTVTESLTAVAHVRGDAPATAASMGRAAMSAPTASYGVTLVTARPRLSKTVRVVTYFRRSSARSPIRGSPNRADEVLRVVSTAKGV